MEYLKEFSADQLDGFQEEVLLTSLALQYAYGRIILNKNAMEHWSLQNNGRTATGT